MNPLTVALTRLDLRNKKPEGTSGLPAESGGIR